MSSTRIPPAERAPYRLDRTYGVAQVLASDGALVFTFSRYVNLARVEDTLAKLNNGWRRDDRDTQERDRGRARGK